MSYFIYHIILPSQQESMTSSVLSYPISPSSPSSSAASSCTSSHKCTGYVPQFKHGSLDMNYPVAIVTLKNHMRLPPVVYTPDALFHTECGGYLHEEGAVCIKCQSLVADEILSKIVDV